MSVAPPTDPVSPGDTPPGPWQPPARVVFGTSPETTFSLDALDLGVIVTDYTRPDRPIVYVNPAAARLTGYTAAELVGQNGRLLLGPHRDQPALAAIRAAIRTGRGCVVELLLRRKDGTDWMNHLALTPLRDPDDRVTHYLGFLADVTRPGAGQLPQPPATPGPRGTVLLVEDEETVRDFVRVVLEQSGYTVVTAADAEEGTRAFAADPARFDLVFSDVLMPGRSGPEMVRELQRTRPDLRVLYMSGFVGGAVAGGGSVPPGAVVLEKPFGIDALLAAVARAAGLSPLPS